MKKFLLFILLFNIISFSVVAQDNENRVPFFKHLFYGIFPTKMEREAKDFFKNDDIVGLKYHIMGILNTQPDREFYNAEERYPLSLYLLAAIVSEQTMLTPEDTVKTFYYYTIARELYAQSLSTDRDVNLIRKAEQKGWMTIQEETAKSNFYDSYYRRKLDLINANIASLRARNTIVNDSITFYTRVIEQLENRIYPKEIELTKIVTNNENAIRYIKTFFNENGIAGEIVETSDAEIITERGVISPETRLDQTGYYLGLVCHDDINDGFINVLNAISDEIDKLPAGYRDKVYFNCEYSGKSDGVGYGTNVGRYGGSSTSDMYNRHNSIKADYYRIDESPVRIELFKDTQFKNEGLAFLRAYCLADVVHDFCESKNIQITSERFYAYEYREKGPEYRGVELNLSIVNLFLHQSDSLRIAKQELERLRREKEVLNEKIKDAETQKKIIETILYHAGYDNDGFVSRVIRRIRGYNN